MPDSPPDRRFDEREVALILQETAALQEREELKGDTRPGGALLPARGRGLTLAQLEQIAREAGLEPTLVRRAAASVESRRTPPRGNRFLGAAQVIDVERTIDGELTEAAHEMILAAVRHATGELGELTAHGRQFGWKGAVDGAKGQIAVSPVGGRTVVRVRLELDEVALGTFMVYGTMLGGFGGIGAFLAAMGAIGPFAIPAGGAVLGAGYLTARTIFTRTAKRLRGRADEIADEVADAVRDSLGEP